LAALLGVVGEGEGEAGFGFEPFPPLPPVLLLLEVLSFVGSFGVGVGLLSGVEAGLLSAGV